MKNYAILILLLSVFGCSSIQNSPTTPTHYQLARDNTDFDIRLQDLPIESQHDKCFDHHFVSHWNLVFDTETQWLQTMPNRDMFAHYNIKPLLEDIMPPTINIVSYDPFTGILKVDVTLKNPQPIMSVYDVRLIIYTDNFGIRLMNPDSWTTLYDISGGAQINPFKAYAKSISKREFHGLMSHTERLSLYFPAGLTTLNYAIDVSFPGNCEEPYEISNFSQGKLYPITNSQTDVEVSVFDWQNNVTEVILWCPGISGSSNPNTILSAIGLDSWGGVLINKTAASPGNYIGCVIAKSSDSGTLALYNIVNIAVSESGNIPLNPQIVGRVETGNFVESVAIDGVYAYVADFRDIVSIDVSQPTNPFIVDSEFTIGGSLGIAVCGQYAYLADGEDGLLIFDKTNPSNLIKRGSVKLSSGFAKNVFPTNSYAYIAYGGQGLVIADVNNPDSPFIISSALYLLIIDDVFVQGDYAYCASWDNALFIVNVANPYSPFLVGQVTLIEPAKGIYVVGPYAYVANGSTGLKIIDASSITMPFIVGGYDTAGQARSVAVSGDYAYIADYSNGVVIVDVSDPTSPEYLSHVDFSGYNFALPRDIAVQNNYAYVAADKAGLIVIQLW